MGHMQPVSVRLQRSRPPRPFGVTLIVLYEFFLVGLIIYGVWNAFSAHFAHNPGASGRDPLVEYFAEIFYFVPFALVFHLYAGVGLFLMNPAGRNVRLAISSLDVLLYQQWRNFFIVECLRQQRHDVRTAWWVLGLEILTFCYLKFYPGVKEKFGRRVLA